MDKKQVEKYEVEDFVSDESFINYHLKLNAGDELFWNTWIESNPVDERVSAAKQLLDSLLIRLPEDELEQEMIKMRSAVDAGKVTKKGQPALPRFSMSDRSLPKQRTRYKKALMFMIPVLLLIGCFFGYQYFANTGSGLARKINNSKVPVVFSLSDGTVVTLAPDSKLDFPETFKNRERKVYLEGEAQFHVKRDEAHPFKVYAGELLATVLGTVFKIKQQPTDSIIQIELLTGKLKVETVTSGLPSQSVILSPEERVLYNRNDQKLTRETWQPNTSEGYRNYLKFSKDNFEAIAKKLKTSFNVTVLNESSKKNWLFTGEFYNSTAKEIVENICIIKGLNYELKADTILIR